MTVEMRFTKWGGHRHWVFQLERLGSDEHGQWFGGRAGIRMCRGDDPGIVQPHDFVTLVPASGCWIATFNKDSAGTDVAVYIDVTDRPRVDDGVIHAVDLDLDVIRLRDGSVRVLDEDEFAEHRIRYGYPESVVAQALATTADLVTRLTAAVQPFETEALTRLDSFTSHVAPAESQESGGE